ncbi:bifunctional phosphoribosyl-AMP cyclohydrolase/phosphoribosyl-ATP diphosphatase HisIE [Enterococcus sp. RIT-PI-f]|uniref:bifunctional phosphoribosyl-AMP cyclohydrolase/phosphoribosyl-ATP diphosphatase HisIE n=1 Tax=Enterococcus sp. RIT-PI-f TaxID=1690244 RepID=UPI0006B8E2CD|nr:bifunctional phosphoribosyl-AMP cyclohydrolase/phosphoribosyl-ATP diphosphatase HisIE [Enterococcus sp. RIT-PI-f]KPG69920.1 phosphoribosyl-ATP pyrophosphatase [Enterococcus sp. RIT-PI-f]
MDIKFDAQGLVPVIVQDFYTNQVLTLAYMNQESLTLTLNEGLLTFYSRSRQELWRKGETSGNYQHLVALTADCDQDALVAKVIKDGPACHLGTESCFTKVIYQKQAEFLSINDLSDLILQRKKDPQAESYTSYLFEKGLEKILKKVGEEAAEVIIAGLKKDHEETIYESADLIYHLLVLLAELDIPFPEIQSELSKRHVVDHKVKQERLGQE